MTSAPALDLALGIDVGGTKIAAGIVELATGRLLARREVPTRAERAGAEVLEDALVLTRSLLGEGRSVRGIGIGIAELVDLQGNVTSGHTVRWQGLPVRERFDAFGPTVVDSDVRAAATAEAHLGAGRDAKDFVYVSVGTGIASCLVLDGRPYPGARGNALVLTTGAPSADRQSLEEVASGPALVRRYAARSARPVTHGREVTQAAEGGDPIALEVLETAAHALGRATAWLVNVLDPHTLVVGGGLGTAGGPYWDRLVETTRAGIWAESSRELPIVRAAFGADAGVVGAALLVTRLRPVPAGSPPCPRG